MDVTEALSALTEKIATWFQTLVTMLPNIAIALAVMTLFWFLARLAMRLTEKAIGRASDNPQVVRLVASAIRAGVLTLGFFIALGVLELDKTVTSLLAGVGVLGIALGFAFQDIAANFVSGVLLAMRRPFRIGDLIETNDFLGRIERTDLRATIVRRLDGPLVIIPNKEVFQNAIVNYSQAPRRRVEVNMGVSYGSDLDLAQDLAIQAVTPISEELGDGKVELYYKEFGGSSIDFVVRFWVNDSEQVVTLETRSRMIKAIKAKYDEHGIDIPFPMRTLDLGVGDQRAFFQRLLGSKDDGDSGDSDDAPQPNGADGHAEAH
ncbi:MAG: mechanosensitive ion channel family protein [Myxococcota bacterium]